MAKKKNGKKVNISGNSSKKRKKGKIKSPKTKTPILNLKLKRWIGAVFMIVAAVVVSFAFFEKAGAGGDTALRALRFIIGNAVYAVPFLLVLGSFFLMKPKKNKVTAPMIISLLLLCVGIAGILASQDVGSQNGGWLGVIVSWPLLRYFSLAISFVVFCAFIVIGVLISWEFLPKGKKKIESFTQQEIIDENVEDKPKRSWFKRKEQEVPDVVEEKKPKLEIKPINIPKKKAVFASIIKQQVVKKIKIKEKVKVDVTPIADTPTLDDGYQRPPINLFDTVAEKSSGGDVNYNASVIQKTFANFGINVEMGDINTGPTVAQFTLKPAEGIKLSRITALNNDLALSLAAHPIRIEAPIPGKSLVGVEVPNKIKAKVKLGSIVASDEFQNSSSHLELGLGMDVMGKSILAGLDRMPHLLVAGATGSGKTICLNSLIISLIARNSPKQLRLILIDPKRVEFPIYANLPHLLTPVILNARKAVNALNWLVGEMERRFEVLREFGVRDIKTYNSDLDKKPKKAELGFESLPYIVLIVDELADLMMSRGKEVEASVVRLSQLARAVGIHLILATQRPSVEVITGLIKANITSRISFQVASQIDSRTILDTSGAEKLLGKGDMLFLSSEFSRPKRIQGSFISAPEIKKIVTYISKENASVEIQDLGEDDAEAISENGVPSVVEPDDIENFSAPDELYEEAKDVVLQYQKASASLLQRRLQVGYARAARILDMLEENGVVGAADGSKPRTILVASPAEKADDGYSDPNDLEFVSK